MCWEAAGDLREAVSDDDYARGLTWDVRLAVALLEATSDPQIGGKFWDVYGRMLPQPHTIAVRIGSNRVAVRLRYVMLRHTRYYVLPQRPLFLLFRKISYRGVLTEEDGVLDC